MNKLSKEEFKKQLMLITKYGGDVEKFLDENICVNGKFTLNHSIRGVLTQTGIQAYNEYFNTDKCIGDEVELQFYDLCRIFHDCCNVGEILPLVDCELC